jgi:hypothetical protein
VSSFEARVRGDADSGGEVACQQYFGKYRGVVTNNVDPESRNRVQAIVPDISSMIPTTWAESCAPPGHAYTPRIGAGLWIEFEQGDPDYPVWTGAIAGGKTDLPVAANLTPPGVAQTTLASPLSQYSISVSDSPSTGIMIKTPGQTMISMTDSGGILITNGTASILLQGSSITLTGTVTVI